MTAEARSKRRGVLLLVGSPSDLEVAVEAEKALQGLGVPSRIQVASAHRTPETVADLARNAETEGFGVIIAFAGLAAHLAGVTAAHSLLPVIGVPIGRGTLGGLDAVLSTLQMPPGTPVGAVGIDSARNAALLAARILSLGDTELRKRLEEMREEDRERYDSDRIASELDAARRRRKQDR
ncbi:MAG: 5-(carboxyamino)imidazole ribonucleotide mutase [Myxococcota bacterium]